MLPEPRPKRQRVSIDVNADVRRRIRVAAAKRDVSVREYVLDAIEQRLREDIGDYATEYPALDAAADPVLTELWDNPADAAYDRL